MSSNPVAAAPKAEGNAVGPQAFLRACAQFSTGVAIATVLDSDGSPHGMTINSFTSVSLEPPLVLICIDHRAHILEHFLKSDFFAINILRETQQALSERFARPAEDRFGTVEWYPGQTGAPLIPDALAVLECTVFQRTPAGDHTILIGEVVNAIRREGQPLVFFSSSYQVLEQQSRE